MKKEDIRKTSSGTFRGWIAAVTLLCLLLTGCSGGDSAAESTEPLVKSAEEAASVLAGRAEELGYANALAELTPVSTTVSGEHTFYRLQQNYNGIPVYGQQVVYVTDAEGRCQAITQNIFDIAQGPYLIPSVSAEMVEGYIYTYIKNELGIDKIQNPLGLDLGNTDLCIYDLSPRDQYDNQAEYAHLVYKIYWESFLFLVDAHSGQVLAHKELIQNLSAPATLATNGETFNALQSSSGTYVLKDMDENIYLFDAGEKVFHNLYSQNINPHGLSMVTSSDSIFGNDNDSVENPQEAEAVFRMVQQIRGYFRDLLNDSSKQNLMVVYNDSCADMGQNAVGGVLPIEGCEYLFPGLDSETDGGRIGVIALGTKHTDDISQNIDVIAHEYVHAASWQYDGWDSRHQEAAALQEAYADIMAELIESHMTGRDPDWIIADRNIRDPASADLPVSRNEAYSMEPHTRSTIISHIAYRMWSGMDGTESKKIPADQLAQLWYKALLMMPSNADFQACYTIVTEAALLMGLDSQQMTCIQESFNNAEIYFYPDAHQAITSPDFTLTALDQKYEPLSRYTVTIEKVVHSDEPLLPTGTKTVIQIDSEEPYPLHLDYGVYRFTYTPKGSKEATLPYYVYVTNCEFGNLCLYSDDRTMGQITCIPCNVNQSEVLPNTQVDIYSLYPRTLVASLNTGTEGTAVTVQLTSGQYVLNIQSEGYAPYQDVISVYHYSEDQHTIQLSALTIPQAPSTPAEPYFTYPEIVTVQADMDYGVYPFPKDFILEDFGSNGGKLYTVYDTDTYGYDEGSEQDTITSSSPYYWWWGTFDASVDAQINEYIDLLSQEPFCLELIYTKDMGQEWVYVYRYTGKHQVYPLNISGFVPADAGEYHLAIDVSKRSDYHGRIALEVAAGYGLEAITPEILEDICHEIGYNRISNASENIEADESLDSGTCYFCYKTVYATPERPIYNEQIVYCDACYAEMFGG